MTDGERARLNDWFRLFSIASSKCVPNSVEGMFYTSIAMTLGAVLGDDPRYLKALEEHVARLKSMGVEPSKSVIERPDGRN